MKLVTSSAIEPKLFRILELARSLPSMTLGAQLLATPMKTEADHQALYAFPVTTSLAASVRQYDPIAIGAFDEAVADALTAMRGAEVTGPGRLVSLLDRASVLAAPRYRYGWTCPEGDRKSVMGLMDWLNEGMGSYDAWLDLMADDLASRERPVRVLELCAGHGKFALAMKERYADAIEVTSTDIFEEYLEIGREAGLERRLDVAFQQQDPTDLRNLPAGSFDVVVCTQSLHHFAPGVIARMLAEASRVSADAVWLIDGERTLLGAALLGAIAAAHTPSWPVLRNTVVSLRSMYTQEELGLIASLAPDLPFGTRVETGRRGPGFAFVRAGSPSSATVFDFAPETLRGAQLSAAE
jgi:SAM-dependent methyltransferase